MRRPTGVRFYTPRDPEFIKPGTDEWRSIITPSKVAAILGEPNDPVSRYESPFRLWHRMKGRTEPEPPADRFRLGHRIEPLAAGLYRDDRPDWLLSPGEVQAHVDPDKFGFPAVATLDRRGVRGSSRRVVEFKLARNLNDLEVWGDDLTGELPDDYHAQVSALMLFTGWTEIPAELLCVGPYINHRIYTVDYDMSFAAWIITKCRAFYESLASDQPPPLDNTLATYECLRELNPDIDPDADTILDEDEALDFVRAHSAMLDATDAYHGARNRLVKRMERDRRAMFGPDDARVKIADRRNNGKGGVSFYPNKAIRPDDLPVI